MSDLYRVQVSPSEALAQFKDFLEKEMHLDLSKHTIIPDGRYHNVPVIGDRPGERAGGYKLNLTGNIGGHATNHKDQMRPWQPTGERVEISPAQARAQAQEAQRQRQQAARERLDAQLAALKTAREILSKSEPASPDHPYLSRKQLPGEGFRQMNVSAEMNGRDIKGYLIIPRYAEVHGNGKLVGLQAISAGGEKLFQKDAPVKGSYRVWGDPREGSEIYIATGAATAAAIYAATRVPTYASFSDGNLLAVAQHVRKSFPSSRITVAADNDLHHTKLGFYAPNKSQLAGDAPHWEVWRHLGYLDNPGVEKATAAAHAIGARVVVPDIPSNHPKKLTDFADVLVERGPEAVRAHFIQAPTPKISPGETAPRVERRHGIRM